MDRSMKLGATGDFPQGKISRDDKGGIRIAILSKGGQVYLDFGDEPILWFAMDPASAEEMAELLMEYAERARRGL